MVCIIDDRKDVWNYAANLIPVKPYTFFDGTADINAPPGSDDDKDTVTEKKGITAATKRQSRVVRIPRQKNKVPASNIVSKPEETRGEVNEQISQDDQSFLTAKNATDDDPDLVEQTEALELEPRPSQVSSPDLEAQAASETIVQTTEQSNQSIASSEAEGKLPEVDEGCSTENTESKPIPDDGKEPEILPETDKRPDYAKEQKEDDADDYEEMIEWIDNDDYLLYLEDILKRIHTAYYELHDQMSAKGERNEVPDMKSIIPYVKKKVLKGTNILFSGVIPVSQPTENSRVYHDAKSLGANVHSELITSSSDGKEPTTHLIAARLGTAKVNAALKHKNIAIVNPQWLSTCAERWERVDEKLYALTEGMNMTGWDSPGRAITPEGGAKFKGGKLRKRGSSGSLKSKTKDTKEKEYVKSTNGEGGYIATVLPEEDDQQQASTSQGAIQGRRFSETYNPLYAFSDADIATMDREVEELLESGSSSDDEADEEALRRVVLGHKRRHSTSSEESLGGRDYPRGWKPASKRGHFDDDEESEGENEGLVDDDKPVTPDNIRKLFKFDDQSSSSNEGSDFDDSVGSVDEEMAAAVEKQFLSY